MSKAQKATTIEHAAKLWGGAFSKGPAEVAWKFGQSIESDMNLWKEEIDVSTAHAQMLAEVALISKEDGEALVSALKSVRDNAAYMVKSHHVEDAEDLHGAIESILVDRVGEAAKRLHAGRSRNDQIVTVARLWLKRHCQHLLVQIQETQSTLLSLAEKHKDDAMPGYTHQQPAQPITLGYNLLAHFWMLERDKKRFQQVLNTTDQSPMGAAALAGTSLPINPQLTSDLLGFAGPIPNALDAVSDRDFVGDALHACATLMQHLSRVAQEIVLFSTSEFGYMKLDEAYSTGSSIMPQKRNPDMAELIRGRAGRVIGHYTGFMSMMKALPLGYNRDQQEDKPPLFDSMQVCADSLVLIREMLSTATLDLPRMHENAGKGFSTATGLAEALVKQGVPFRTAHELVGAWVKLGGTGVPSKVSSDVSAVIEGFDASAAASIASRESIGGPGPKAMQVQLDLAQKALAASNPLQSGNQS